MKNQNSVGILLVTFLVSAIVSGCATKKSEPSAEFLAPISDQTMEIVNEAYFGLQLADSVLLNHYLDADTPRVDAWSSNWDDLTSAVRAIAYFSADLVDIVEAAEGPEANDPFIAILNELGKELRALPAAKPHLNNLDVVAVSQSIREQDTIIDAIRVAGPAMDEIVEIVSEILAAADESLAGAVIEVYEMLDVSHAPMQTFRENLTVRQNDTLRQLDLMDKVWSGDRDAWAELLASDWVVASEVGEDSNLTPATAKQAEKILIRRLETVATIRQYLESARIAYQGELQELYVIEEDSEAMLRLALLIIENWDNAQAQLVAGEKGAFSKLTSSLMGVAYKAAGSAAISSARK